MAKRARGVTGRARCGLGSARVSRVGERVLAIANFSCDFVSSQSNEIQRKACFGATPKPTRERRALPGADTLSLSFTDEREHISGDGFDEP